jgi:cell wall-associated NlpC family hydrolase
MLPAVFVPVAVVLASTGTTHAPSRPADTGDRVERIARTFLRTPYVWGGESRSGVDCSGLVVAVYRRLGVKLPHQSDQLWHGLFRVRKLRKGDVVAFGSHGYSSHVGIYIGHGRFIHAVGAGKGVQIGWLHGRHAHRGYLGAVRPKVRLRRARQAGDAVQHATAVLRGGERVHHRDPEHGTLA